jgi:hypothetical protein
VQAYLEGDLVRIFGYLPNGTPVGWRIELTHGLINAQIIEFKNVIFNDVEAIVHVSNPLAHLIDQAGGLQGRAPAFMANLYLHQTTAYESVSQGASGLQPFLSKDVSTVPGCIHRVLRSTSR